MNYNKIVYSSKVLCQVYCRISQIRYPEFKKVVEARAKLDLFEYRQIAQPLPKCYYELCTDNGSFGIGWCIRHYCGITKSYLNAMVEHGYFFGNYVQEMEKVTFAKKLFTFGDIRKKHIEAVVKDKEVILIGPYIHYAPDYYDSEHFAIAKKEIGRTLLVFFSHSATGTSVSFDLDALIETINSIRKDFQTVVISLFWSDINPDIEKRLKNEEYLIFSSGHRYDYYFLSRQKTMIQLADMTMSNSVGTHVAYCTYLGKPHWIIRQKIERKALNKIGAANIEIASHIGEESSSQVELKELYEAFSDYHYVLTDEQKRVCNKYFGFNYVRTPEEMRELVISK